MCNLHRQLTSVNTSSILANRNRFAWLAYNRGVVSSTTYGKVKMEIDYDDIIINISVFVERRIFVVE